MFAWPPGTTAPQLDTPYPVTAVVMPNYPDRIGIALTNSIGNAPFTPVLSLDDDEALRLCAKILTSVALRANRAATDDDVPIDLAKRIIASAEGLIKEELQTGATLEFIDLHK
jgi:hypothetical protein